MLNDLINKYKSSEFVKNSFTLTLGTSIAQILPFIFYPILGRIYTPSEFGVLATISAITPILTIFASGMYEGAILISKSKIEAANIIGLIILRSLFVLTFFLLVIFFFANEISIVLKEPGVEGVLFVAPFASFAMVIYNCFNEWCVTNKYFYTLSINKIINTSTVSVGKTIFGLSHFLSSGLVWGDLVGKLVSAVSCVYRAFKSDNFYFSKIKFRKFKSLAKKYNNFPKYLMTDQILNNIGGSIHIFFVSIYFDNKELGYLSMAMTFLTVPVTVISSAIKDVFRQKANNEFIQTGSCRPTYLRLLKPITLFSLIFFSILFFILPSSFLFVLGNQWQKTGVYAQILVPMFITNFISMSLGGVLIIANKIKISLVWQLFTIFMSASSFIIGIHIYNDITITIILFMIARSISYILYGYLSYYFAIDKKFVKM